MGIWTKLVSPFRSRKNRVALATIIAAYLAEAHLAVDIEVIVGILGVGVSLILGIAHEDNGAKRNEANAHARITATTFNDGAN